MEMEFIHTKENEFYCHQTQTFTQQHTECNRFFLRSAHHSAFFSRAFKGSLQGISLIRYVPYVILRFFTNIDVSIVQHLQEEVVVIEGMPQRW